MVIAVRAHCNPLDIYIYIYIYIYISTISMLYTVYEHLHSIIYVMMVLSPIGTCCLVDRAMES